MPRERCQECQATALLASGTDGDEGCSGGCKGPAALKAAGAGTAPAGVGRNWHKSHGNQKQVACKSVSILGGCCLLVLLGAHLLQVYSSLIPRPTPPLLGPMHLQPLSQGCGELGAGLSLPLGGSNKRP
jgi:hypothetical protein